MVALDAVKKAILAGLGALAYTQEKVSQVIEELAERGEITREQAAKVVKEFAERASKERTAFCEKVASEVREILDRAPIVTRGDLDALRADLHALREEVAALRERMQGGGGERDAPPAEPS